MTLKEAEFKYNTRRHSSVVLYFIYGVHIDANETGIGIYGCRAAKELKCPILTNKIKPKITPAVFFRLFHGFITAH